MHYNNIDKKTVLFLFLGVYVVLFLAFYPSFFTTVDEGNFLRSAFLLLDGKLSITDPEYQLGFGYALDAYYPFFIGESLLLIPFVLFSWKGAFFLGVILHIIATVIFYRMVVVERGKSVWYIPLFLFFPYFIYYSTTLYSDFAAGPLVLAAFFLYNKGGKHSVPSGLLFGFAALLKYTNILIFVPFFLYTLVKDRKKLLYLLIGFLPLVLFIGWYNASFFGSPFNSLHTFSTFSGYGKEWSSVTAFSFLSFLPFIVYRLLFILPFMVVAPFFYKGKGRYEILGVYILFLLFWGSRLQSGLGFGFSPSTLTRYILPIMPLILLTYPDFIDTVFRKAKANVLFKPIMIGAATALIIGSVVVFWTQSAYFTTQYTAQQDIYEQTPDHALIIGEGTINRYIMEPFGDRRFLDTFRYTDFGPYIDDKTFIVHKSYEEGVLTGFYLELSLNTEKLIDDLDTELVFEKHYPAVVSAIATKPFTISIYKVVSHQ